MRKYWSHFTSAIDFKFDPEYCQHMKSPAVGKLNAEKISSGLMLLVGDPDDIGCGSSSFVPSIGTSVYVLRSHSAGGINVGHFG